MQLPTQAMLQPQYNIYTDLVTTLEVMGVKPNKDQLGVYVRALEPFSDPVRKAAIDAVALTINKRPLPADFANAAKQICGVDSDSLKRRGAVQFNKLIEIGSDTRSVLCDDWRIVHAVKTAFGSLSMFFNSREEQVWMQKAFANAYASVDFLLEYTIAKEYLLDNDFYPCAQGGYRPLIFLGDYNNCMRLYSELPNKHEFMVPCAPNKQLIQIEVPQKLTPEQKAANQARLDDILESFNRGLKVENQRTA